LLILYHVSFIYVYFASSGFKTDANKKRLLNTTGVQVLSKRISGKR